MARLQILGPDGRPIRKSRPPDLAAQYDVSYTTSQNAEHWALATSGDANIAYDYQKRRESRNRARYETANNNHLRGMVTTKTFDVVGNVTLQMDGKQEIEQSFNAWAREIGLHEKLVTLYGAGKLQDGEGIGLIVDNPFLKHEIKLDVRVLEPEQMGNPDAMADTDMMYDGIEHVNDVPIRYYIYDRHPDSGGIQSSVLPYVGQWYDASRVIHIFRKYRAGQLRGATELGPALPLAAVTRRYTMAVLHSAETAASTSLWLQTDGAPEESPTPYNEPFESMPVVHNQLITAPYGWKINQVKPEQPIDRYDAFLRCIVTQMARALNMPAALSYGDASDYNMASGRLDKQDYIRDVQTEQSLYLEYGCLEKILRFWLQFYLATRAGISPSDIDAELLARDYGHRWSYRPINHSDPETQARADAAMWQNGHLTDRDILYRLGKDPEQHYKELEDQNKRRAKLGMPAPGMMPGMPVAGQTTAKQGNANGQTQQNGQQKAASPSNGRRGS